MQVHSSKAIECVVFGVIITNLTLCLMLQVNQWLTWLETAEEEESEDEEY